MPPAFRQSASVFAAVMYPAKAGPVKATAKVTARIEMKLFMTFSPYAGTKARHTENVVSLKTDARGKPI